MRKRNVMIGMAGALALSLAVAGSAQAAGTLTGQTLEVTATAGKLDKKVLGPVSNLNVVVNTQYNGTTPPFTGKVINTKVDFPKDFVFTPPTAQCDPNSPGFSASTTEAAMAACGPAQVGSGSANLAGAVAGVTAVVTAFNGTQPAGNPTILLHSRTTAGTTTVLVGALENGVGGTFGKQLNVTVPILPLGFVITRFQTAIPQLLTVKGKKANKKRGKKAVPAKYYVGAKCSTKNWTFQARSTADTGAAVTTNTSTSRAPRRRRRRRRRSRASSLLKFLRGRSSDRPLFLLGGWWVVGRRAAAPLTDSPDIRVARLRAMRLRVRRPARKQSLPAGVERPPDSPNPVRWALQIGRWSREVR